MGSRVVTWGVLAAALLTGVTLMGQGVGQTPSPFPLSQTIRERGTSVTGAYEGWYYGKDGAQYALVGYFNRNTKQEFDIPIGPNNRIEPGGPDMGQPTHFLTGRQWGVFVVKLPKDLGNKRLTWTIVANGFTNTITLHTQADYVVEPYEDAANKNTPPKIKFDPAGQIFTGPPMDVAAKYSATVGTPLAMTTWVSDEGPKINIPDPNRARGRGRGTAAARGGAGDAAAGSEPAAGRGDAAAQGRGGRGGRAAGAGAAGAEFPTPPRIAITWSKMRGPGDVKFDASKPTIDFEHDGKATTNATFSAAGDYLLRVEGNDSTGSGGGGFQCCWSTAYVAVTVK
jgi:hypothetical protein